MTIKELKLTKEQVFIIEMLIINEKNYYENKEYKIKEDKEYIKELNKILNQIKEEL